jgi:probable rRNA maturation factor
MPTRRTSRRRPRAATGAAADDPRGVHGELAIQYAAPRAGLPARASVAAWLAQALPGRRARITVRFVGAAEGRRLNRDYRGRDYATNVLTFGYDAPRLEGDIVLCAPVVVREARGRSLPVRAHFAHLVVHGALHLAGHDHERARDAAIMEAAERGILAQLGFDDPYPRRRRPGRP